MIHTHDDHTHDEHANTEPPALRSRVDMASLLRLHPRLLLGACIAAVVMFPVGLFLAAVGVAVLELSGGAARDTSIVVAIAGYVVADFWGGGIVAAITKARAPQVAAAWGAGRLLVLVLVALLAPGVAALLPVQLVLAVPAAWAGARVARKQAALRRQIRAERSSVAGRTVPSTGSSS